MKALPCNNCQPHPSLSGRTVAMLRDGKPYVIGRPPSPFPARIFCAQCKRTTMLQAKEYHALPELTLAELDALEALEPLLHDYLGMGHPDREARDLFAAGWKPLELAELAPQAPPTMVKVVPPAGTEVKDFQAGPNGVVVAVEPEAVVTPKPARRRKTVAAKKASPKKAKR